MGDFFSTLAQSPVYFIVFIVAVVGGALSIPPALKAIKIGNVRCGRCGHVGKLKQTMTNKLLCAKCGADDWKPVEKDAA